MREKTPWFSEAAGFFGPEYLAEYEGLLSLERTQLEVDFLEKALGLQRSDQILDVPCGHGRHSIELAKRGYQVTGAELNEFFLNHAQTKAKDSGVRVSWDQVDMRELSYEQEFDVAINMFTSLGYFATDAEDEQFMAGVYQALRPGGQFLLDFMNRNRVLRDFKANGWEQLPDGSILLIEREYDDLEDRMYDRRKRVVGGEVRDIVTTTLRLYTTKELLVMAERAGFLFAEAYGDFAAGPLELDSPRLLLRFSK